MKNHYPKFLQFILLILISTMSYGQSTVSKHAGIGENISRGQDNWSNPGSITANDGSFTFFSPSKNGKSNYIQGTNYGFNIPAGATIEGIQVTINRKSSNNGSKEIKDEIVSLVKQGKIMPTNKSKDEVWTNKDNIEIYGGKEDLWNTTWTPADINAENFGVVLAISCEKNNTASVDYMQITIHYSMPTDDIEFNGRDTYANFGNNFSLNSDFSIELWIYRDNNEVKTETLFSKRNPNGLNGYELSVTDKKLTFSWDGQHIQSSKTIKNKKWHHVAITFKSGSYKLYIDGMEVASMDGKLPSAYTGNALLGASGRGPNAPTNYFSGSMDELRIWNVALSEMQIREMMNQEIEKNGDVVRGSVLKLDLSDALSWKNLQAYYQMNQGTDISVGQLTDNSGSGRVGTLVNMKSNQLETAPLPYISRANGNWTDTKTWENGDAQQLPNAVNVDDKTSIDWNIVRTEHDITATDKNIKVLGLLVDANRLTIQNSDSNDGHSLEVTKWLNISEGAVLDLVGESQLLQGKGSLVGPGKGVLERDQQGTGNMFNYNYWGSPVSTAGTSDSRTYTLAGVLFDGNNPVLWTTGKNGSPTSPAVTLSSRWLYTYKGGANDYNAWKRISQNSEIKVGNGFLMKGAGATTAKDKNYTFKGHPNNGTIKIPIEGAQAMVVGNPYPSALDADQFLKDNEAVLKSGSALQFWEQSPDGSTHVYADYQGRYSYYVMTGSLPSATPPSGSGATSGIGGVGKSTKTPGRYIPVAQGFFVEGNNTGGTIKFNNEQRAFIKEANGQSVFLRSPEVSSKETQKRDADTKSTNAVQRVRLAFKTPEGATRYLLLGFTPDNAATDGIDYGYDGLNSDDFPSDLSFGIAGKKFVIQGVGAFDINKKYPLDMTLKIAGAVELSLTGLENFETPIDVFVHDAELDTYTQINAMSFQSTLDSGNYTERFSIVFRPDSTLSTIDKEFKEVNVKYLQNTNEIYIKTPASIEIRQVNLITITGQSVTSWDLTTNYSQEHKIPVKDIAVGNYILQVETNTNSYTKKIMVK